MAFGLFTKNAIPFTEYQIIGLKFYKNVIFYKNHIFNF